ncbi:unnamed protein product [Cylicostephanus goldi]|uniref:Uncharacterized protein n=1 Tax=Cylicostephanus goldi TaxID=71465 RepID=A0A3P6QIC2_CYLGO|nr:unnamed protein product [Cylicostephanus goldi]
MPDHLLFVNPHLPQTHRSKRRLAILSSITIWS